MPGDRTHFVSFGGFEWWPIGLRSDQSEHDGAVCAMHPPTALLIEGPFASDTPDQISTKVERSADTVTIVKYVSATP